MARHGMDCMAWHVNAINKRIVVMQCFITRYTLNNIVTVTFKYNLYEPQFHTKTFLFIAAQLSKTVVTFIETLTVQYMVNIFM
jgi:hypothetical protein